MKNKICIYIITLCSFLSCATLPKSTVELSVMLDKQITVLEQTTLNVVDCYFDEKRSNIMDFMNNEWYPSYLKLFFEDPEVIAHWDSIVSCNDMAQRIELMKEMTDVIYMDFKAQSDSMLLPLSQIEKELIKELKTEYALARTMNNAITQNVKSVNELQEKRTELLKQLDTDDVLKNAFDKATEEASKISDQMQKLVDQYNKNEKKIDNLIDKTIKK